MASVSTSHMILFIASLIVAASVAGTFTNGIERLSGALGDRSLDVSNQIQTDIEIISDAEAGNVYNGSGNENISVLIKNTGSQDLDDAPFILDVIVDGAYQTDVTMTVIGSSNGWHVGEVARVNISTPQPLPTGDHRVKIIVNKDEEVLEFRT